MNRACGSFSDGMLLPCAGNGHLDLDRLGHVVVRIDRIVPVLPLGASLQVEDLRGDVSACRVLEQGVRHGFNALRLPLFYGLCKLFRFGLARLQRSPADAKRCSDLFVAQPTAGQIGHLLQVNLDALLAGFRLGFLLHAFAAPSRRLTASRRQ